jgi:nucleotide-binding universal stress UspA family protein
VVDGVERSAERRRGRIVVGVDGSPTSARALSWALRQAESTGSVLEAVHVQDLTASVGMVMSVSRTEDAAAAIERMLSRAVEDAAGGEPTVAVEYVVESGHPAAVLLHHAKQADLLVLGSRGHGGFIGTLLGSVSQHCIRHASCPVVVIRKQ